MANVTKRPLYQVINGVRFPEMFSPECIQESLDYKPKPDDVFIVTYPKCGTTWIQNIALYIFRKGKELENPSDFMTMCPFIDILGREGIEKMPKPGALKTHVPFTHLSYSPEAKYIYVLRNPKDCCVSLYYHTKNIAGFGYWDAEFDDFFELFMAGEVEYNGYFDHLISFYPHRNDRQIFFTTYEDMKKDTKAVVLRLASFLGKEFIDAIEMDNKILNNILHFSGFDYMKKNISELYDTCAFREAIIADPNAMKGTKHMAQFTDRLEIPNNLPKLEFVRKGVTGDWRSHFSAEQSERLNKKFLETTAGTEFQEMYKSFM